MPPVLIALTGCLAIIAGSMSRGDDPTPAQLLRRAETAADRGRFEVADQIYRKIIAQMPRSPEAETARERLQPNSLLHVHPLEENGRSENRIDVFVLGDGFKRQSKYQRIFDGFAEDTVGCFFQCPTFKRYRSFFNFHAMNIASREDGVDRPGRDYDTALDAYQTEWSQGQVAVRRKAVMRYLAKDSRNDGLAIVIVRKGALGTGGGGVAVVGGGPGNTVIHEWGHAFGSLLDEYTADVGYAGETPHALNVSNTDDLTQVPWRHWIDAGVKGVGTYAGAAGRSQGAWRPTARGCSMAQGNRFCVVCREVLVANIYGIVSPIDAVEPPGRSIRLRPGENVVLRVIPMPVAGTPALEVTFTLAQTDREEDPAGRLADREDTTPAEPGGLFRDRREQTRADRRVSRRSLRPRWGLPATPEPGGRRLASRRVRTKAGKRAVAAALKASDLEVGEYLVHVRVRDPVPWVVRDDWRALLADTWTWHLRVAGDAGQSATPPAGH